MRRILTHKAAAAAGASSSSDGAGTTTATPWLVSSSFHVVGSDVAQFEEVLSLLTLLFKSWTDEPEMTMRVDMLHQLALGPHPHSFLCKRLEGRWGEHPQFDATLRELSGGGGGGEGGSATGKYGLDPKLWGEVDPTHPYFTPEEAKRISHRLHAMRSQAAQQVARAPSRASPATRVGMRRSAVLQTSRLDKHL